MGKRGRPSSKQSDHSNAARAKAKDSGSQVRRGKPCDKIHCPCKEPTCFAQASEKCTGSLWTPRWYHLSENEHYCTDCFEHFHKTNRPGNTVYNLWKESWVRESKGEAAIRLFMADQVLSFWVQCTLCEKWRILPLDQNLTPDLINDFRCEQIYASSGPPCDLPEVAEAQNAVMPHWINTLSLAPMLKYSPAFPLLTNYTPVALGMTASKFEYLSDDLKEKSLEMRKQMEEARRSKKPFCPGFYETDDNQLDLIKQGLSHPFLDVGEELVALAMRPDAMEEHEKLIFSEYSKEQAMYLCLRNVIYTLWMKDPTRWLSIQEVAKHLICRGLSRIRCVYEAQRVLHHLTQRGIVNHGHLIPPPELPRLPPTRVIVVGAGIGGLAAGRHLSNLGMKITVLEAGNRIGGRVQCMKNQNDGLTICAGADRVLGVINNPIASLAYQCGVSLQGQDESQMILQPGGTIVDPVSDETVDELFGLAVNAIIEWRQELDLHAVKQPHNKKSNASQATPPQSERDENLESKLDATLMKVGANKILSKDEAQVMESYKSLLEICHGTSLSNVSAKMSIQNAFSPQFSGCSAMVPGGIGPLLEDLSSGLEVKLACEVKSITLVDSGECRARVNITSENEVSEDIDADYVVVAVPLHVLQKNAIKFEPSLPQALSDYINQLGCGVVEQIVAEFPHSFWRPSNEEHRRRLIMRTIEPDSEDERGLFPFFVDVSAYDKDGVERFLLKSYVIGTTAKKMKNLSEADVVSEYIRVLRKYFGEIPEPLQNVVSAYSTNDHIGMAYTYPKVGCNLEDIRSSCDPVIDNTVFFAGEHFSQNFSRTLAGTYLSGLDAAARIVHRSLYGDDVPFIQSGV